MAINTTILAKSKNVDNLCRKSLQVDLYTALPKISLRDTALV